MTDASDGDRTATTARTDLPEFERLLLSISVEETLETIHDTITGLHAASTESGATIRTTDGRLVAIVQEGDSDTAETRFHYRVAPRSESMTRKAGKLKGALDQFEAETVSPE